MTAYYSSKELLLRLLWAFFEPVLFRFSPRLFYGWRNMILRIFGASIGNNVQIFPSARIMFPWLLTVGNNVVVSWDVKIYNLGAITIGDNTIISQYAHLCGGTHDYNSPDFTLLRTGLTIGKNVWIAADAFVGPGISVGDNVVVGARAVVLNNVGDNILIAGNPAKEIRKIDKPARTVK